MPIANNVKKSLLDFYENSDTNVYDDYGDDFEADSDHGSSLDDAKETEKNSKYIERETTNNTEKSVLFKKRTERTLTASAGYTNNNRMAHSSSLTPRTKPAGRRPEKSRTLTGSSMKKGMYQTSPRQANGGVVVKRVLSANRNKVNALHNLILELQNENEQLRLENRDLKRSSRIQEKAIKKFDNEEAEIPFLIQKHSSEVRVLREKIKRQKDGLERSHDEAQKKDIEIRKLRDKVKRYEELIKEKQLDDREKLQQRLSKLENDLNEKELKISELERVIKLGEKTRLREVKEKNEKYKKALEELKRLENTQKDLQYRFKEKEKELEVQNIYSQRIALKKKMNKPQSKQSPYPNLNSSRLSPSASPLVMDASGSSRERTDERIDENTSHKDVARTQSPESSQVETMVSALRKREEELERMLEEERKRRQFEDDQRMLKEMEEKIRRKEEEIKMAEREREERRREEEKMKEEKMKEERKRLTEAEREIEERKVLQKISMEKEENLKEIKRLESEALNEMEKVNTKQDYLNKLEKDFDKQHVAQSNYSDDDGKTKESNEKKELLLERLKAIDQNGNTENPLEIAYDAPYQTTIQSKPVAKSKTRPIFLESSRKDDDPIKHAPLDFRLNDGKRRGSKEYNFKSTDENLHKGLPSHPDLLGDANDRKQKSDDLLFGEYSPTVSSGGKKRASKYRKPDKQNEEKEDFLFFDTKTKARSGDVKHRKGTEVGQGQERDIDIKPKGIVDEVQNSSSKQQTKPGQSAPGATTVFGAYQPTVGNSNETTTDPLSPDNDPFAEAGPKYGRRGKVTKNGTNEGLFEAGLSTARSGSLFKDAERQAGTIGTTAVKAVSSFADDDIEEMTLI